MNTLMVTGCAGLRIHNKKHRFTFGPSHCWNSAARLGFYHSATWSGQFSRKGPDEKSPRRVGKGVPWCPNIDQRSQIQVQVTLSIYLDLVFFEVIWAQSHVPLGIFLGGMMVDPSLKAPVKTCIQWRSLKSFRSMKYHSCDKSFCFFIEKNPWMLCNLLQGRTCG